ncbi:BMP family ABC transporter substrate-binding protein [Aeromicrobium sp.]|uniref:BMP family lipoprotein n=1 Tax=Aeromicrobium sp. TaxID=1871063 RepID=UPI0025BA5E7F|nr:BMP family ABC transporter substrate-binding protein [Aeromicrobium sp.]
MTKFSAVAAVATLALAGCGSSDSSGSNGGSGGKPSANKDVCKTAKGDGPKIGLAYDVGGRGDQSFNDSAYAGLEKAVSDFSATCVEGEATDGEAESAREDRLRNFAESGATAIVGVGFAYADSVNKVAPDFPDVNFAIVDGFDPDKTPNANVAYLTFAANEGSFLAGVAAAEKSKSGTIGFVGGVNNALIQGFEAGYVAGAKAAKPDIKVEVAYIEESNLKGFNDSAGGKAAATGEFDKGADIVYHAAGNSGSGIFDAAVEAGDGKFAIGVDSDQYLTATNAQKPHILTSALKRVDVATLDFIKSVDAGKPVTSYVTYDLKNDGVGYSTSGGFIDDITSDLEGYKAKIVAGDIKVPTAP